MSTKFIPNADIDFKTMAESFARTIARNPQRYDVSQDESDLLSETVAAYSAAYQKAKFGSTRSPIATRHKNEARKAAEQIIRRIARVIRANDDIDDAVKDELNIRPRGARPKKQVVPMEPPRLWFVRALHEARTPLPLHELKFRALDRSKPKPAGAVRLELFVDLVPPDEPIPTHPGANLNSRPWYLRSYTRSPIVLSPPMTTMPMRVLYWGRWADSTGNVGPFSETVVGWVEGGPHHKGLPALNKPNLMPPLPPAARPDIVEACAAMADVEEVIRGRLCSDLDQPAEDQEAVAAVKQ